MQLEVGSEVLKVVVVGQLIGDLLVEGDAGLIGPAPGHVPDCVTSTSKEHQWQVVPGQNTCYFDNLKDLRVIRNKVELKIPS